MSMTHLPDLGTLIDGAAEATVSRSVLRAEGARVVLFAFDAGQELSEHTVPHDALVVVLDGEVEITVAGTPHRVKEGETILMPGGEPHAVRAVERFKMCLTMIRT